MAATARLQIRQLGSMARSGETLFLRSFAAHPQVHVVHDLLPTNTAAETRLFSLLRLWPANEIDRAPVEQLLGQPLPASVTHLLLKQGVFQPVHDWQGVVLLRNPYAVFSSLWRFDAQLAGQRDDPVLQAAYWRARRLPRLLAWADALDPTLSQRLRQTDEPLQQFLLFYACRARQLLASGQPLCRYEDFVNRHAEVLPTVCTQLGLPWHDALLQAHQRYPAGREGHGGIDLSAPVRPGPDWSPRPELPLAPFVELVSQLGLDKDLALYQSERALATAARH